MRAALSAHQQGASVAILTKVHPVRSHSNAAQGGINAALTDRGDKWEDHAFETVKGSDYLADQNAVEVLAQEAGQDIISRDAWVPGVLGGKNELEPFLFQTSQGKPCSTFSMNKSCKPNSRCTKNGL
jgi:hypothetical protein